ncbi:hypothetical protein BJ508DRAFT_38127 [Ascobolus immersus RN42]|uniref:Uncharacterized protein n=1 Tax=Ascobolus immersus RN42 TaxID=1160509 RepID=A0A3N4IG38_ASCIM|nr:hypothetical protein BJ508DRAFT_38127 [Ascobolus immersus RN42]
MGLQWKVVRLSATFLAIPHSISTLSLISFPFQPRHSKAGRSPPRRSSSPSLLTSKSPTSFPPQITTTLNPKDRSGMHHHLYNTLPSHLFFSPSSTPLQFSLLLSSTTNSSKFLFILLSRVR